MSLRKPKTASKSKKNIAKPQSKNKISKGIVKKTANKNKPKPADKSKSSKKNIEKKPLNKSSKALSKKVKSAVKKQVVKVKNTANKKVIATKKQLGVKKAPVKKTNNLKTISKSKSVSNNKLNKDNNIKLTQKQNIKSKITETKSKNIKKSKVSVNEKSLKNLAQLNKEFSSKNIKKQTNNTTNVKTPIKQSPIEKPVKSNEKVVAVKQTPVVKNVITSKPLPKQQENKEIITKTKHVAEPKGKFEIEFVLHSSTAILFEFLVSPSGLSEWFCDDVNIRNDIYTFLWDGIEQAAKLVKIIEEKLARFEWIEKTDGSYFEFRIEKDELTNDTSLIVTDFAENDDDKKSSQLLWSSQIDKLLHVLGSNN
jgi:hypothetical protein